MKKMLVLLLFAICEGLFAQTLLYSNGDIGDVVFGNGKTAKLENYEKDTDMYKKANGYPVGVCALHVGKEIYIMGLQQGKNVATGYMRSDLGDRSVLFSEFYPEYTGEESAPIQARLFLNNRQDFVMNSGRLATIALLMVFSGKKDYSLFDFARTYKNNVKGSIYEDDSWFIPSINELSVICTQKEKLNKTLKKLKADTLRSFYTLYWSSSQFIHRNLTGLWVLDFGTNTIKPDYQNGSSDDFSAIMLHTLTVEKEEKVQ